MAQRLRATVHGIVLGAGMGLEVVVVIALHAQHGLHAQYGVQIGVFAAGLLTASPSGVTEDVDIGAPEGEFGIAWVIGDAHRHVEHVVVGTVPVGAGLVGDGAEHVIYLLGVEGGGHTDRLGEHGVVALAHAVAGLAPPVVGGDAEAVDRHRLVHHQSHLFFGGEQ